MDCWYFATSFYNDFAALGNQLTRYRSFIILSCFGNDRARAVTIVTNTSPLRIVAVTGNILKLFKKPGKKRKNKRFRMDDFRANILKLQNFFGTVITIQ